MATAHWTDAGYQDMMDVYFRGATAPSAFAMRLVLDTVVGTDNWADVSANEKATQGGYTQNGITINRDATANGWPTLALDSSEMQIVGKKCSWTASANWATAVTAVCLVADKATDQLIAYAAITSQQPLINEIVSWTPKLKLTKV